MGRKRKFGEESAFVSVRVPKSKRREYRTAIKRFVEKKFASESITNENISNGKISKKDLTGFRKFEEFVKTVKEQDETERND